METLSGGCHCGAVRFRVSVTDRRALRCNCSICTMSGYLHLIVNSDAFELIRGSDALGLYQFNTGVARHTFCRSCGIKAFYTPRSHPDGISVNARCLDDLRVEDFDIKDFNGAHWEANVDAIRG